MKKHLCILLLGAALAQAQPATTPPPQKTDEAAAAEQTALRQAMAETGGSPVELTRALERHLKKYPNSKQRDEIERALAKIAVEQRDSARLIRYGERVLAKEPDDLLLLERVTRALLATEDKAAAGRALGYAKRFEQNIGRIDPNESGRNKVKLQDELEQGQARALVFQARANGLLGKPEEAAALAQKAVDRYLSAEAAREAGRWLAASGHADQAIPFYALAFAMPDARSSDGDRAKDRARLGELYQKVKGSEMGMGDTVITAYDRATRWQEARKAKLREADPNSAASSAYDFVLSSVEGKPVSLSSLKGKVIVMDLWATWCGPCRVQHPLYEQVKQRFKTNQDVVFLQITTDEDRSLVRPFLDQQQWSKNVYFDDGLAGFLQVGSIPTTLIFDKQGDLVTRLNGFVPERFVDMLTDRIKDALESGS